MDRLEPVIHGIETVGGDIRTGHRGVDEFAVFSDCDVGAGPGGKESSHVGDSGDECSLGVGGEDDRGVPVVGAREKGVFIPGAHPGAEDVVFPHSVN